jgi:hypothetical protein
MSVTSSPWQTVSVRIPQQAPTWHQDSEQQSLRVGKNAAMRSRAKRVAALGCSTGWVYRVRAVLLCCAPLQACL